jgi:MFS-type transporter involved in bile tolerance (Atg22 family)
MDGVFRKAPPPSESDDEKRRELQEARGWTLDAAARGVVVMGSAVFVSSALLRLAKEEAGCNIPLDTNYDENDEMFDCKGRVLGMRPSSLLTNILMVVGLVSACVMPLIGSVIDHTRFRRLIGRLSAACLIFFIVLQVIALDQAWVLAAVIQIFIAVTYSIHLCAVYAYLPELSKDQEKLVNYAAQFTAAQYASSVMFLLVMVAILSWWRTNDVVLSAQMSQLVVFVVSSLFFGIAWTCLFRVRPASQQVPPGRTVLTAGFYKIQQTAQTILLHHTAIKWFLVATAFTESAVTAFSTIAITYMTYQLDFGSRENGFAILLLLLFGVPGTMIASTLSKWLKPIRSLQACLLLWIINTSLAALVLKGAGQQRAAYFFAMIWGLCTGWVYPTEKALYCTIIPRGQEAELMGAYISACQALAWLPPLVFTIMNEAGISMRAGLFSLSAYFLCAFFTLFLMGDYDEAVAHAKDVDEANLTNNPKSLNRGMSDDDFDTMGCNAIV